eukprot:tig00000405_g499.t1
MDWSLLLWLFLFLLTAAALFVTIFGLISLSDLENDYINPVDLSERLNQLVMPEYGGQALLAALLLLFGHWLFALVMLPVAGYHGYLYSKRQHRLDPTSVFQTVSVHKNQRYAKMGLYLVVFFYVLYRLIWAGVESLVGGDPKAGIDLVKTIVNQPVAVPEA